MLLIMDRSLNAIWRVRVSRPWWLSVIGYVLLVLSGPVLIAVSVSLTTYLMSLSEGVAGAGAVAHDFMLRAVPVSMSTLAFFMLYRIIPHRPVPWKHAMLGGFVAAVLFEAAKELFRFYVRHSPTYSVVWGTFAAIPVFLIWIYLSWLVILFGAELTASAAYWRDGLWRQAPRPAVRFREAVSVMQALLEAAHGLTFRALQARTQLPPHELEETLAQLVDAAVVKKNSREGYSLTRETREVLATAPAADDTVTRETRGKARSGKSSR
jgi:membrane protein